MTIEELRAELRAHNIDENACLLLPPVIVEGPLCLAKEGGVWRVAVNERGEFLIDKKFFSESEACDFYLMAALSDPTFKKEFKVSVDVQDYLAKRKELRAKYGKLTD